MHRHATGHQVLPYPSQSAGFVPRYQLTVLWYHRVGSADGLCALPQRASQRHREGGGAATGPGWRHRPGCRQVPGGDQPGLPAPHRGAQHLPCSCMRRLEALHSTPGEGRTATVWLQLGYVKGACRGGLRPRCLSGLQGKVRDTYVVGDLVVIVTTDRQSAFDRLLAAIPFKASCLCDTLSVHCISRVTNPMSAPSFWVYQWQKLHG